MNWKNRLTNYNFWISIVSAVLLIFQAFHLEFDIAYINEIVTAVLGLLVVIGIISDPTKVKKDTKTTENNDPVKTEENINAETKETLENLNEECVSGAGEQVPNETKNEDNVFYNENDYETLIKQISSDLNDKFNKLYSQFMPNKSVETPAQVELLKEEEQPQTENSNKQSNAEVVTENTNITDFLISNEEVEINPTDNSHPIVG